MANRLKKDETYSGDYAVKGRESKMPVESYEWQNPHQHYEKVERGVSAKKIVCKNLMDNNFHIGKRKWNHKCLFAKYDYLKNSKKRDAEYIKIKQRAYI